MSVYLDCNATTPLDPEVEDEFLLFVRQEFGNAGSRTHEFGNRAHRAIEKARERVAAVVRCRPAEVIFTSGATESNNLAILGLRDHGIRSGKRHIISTAIEHKAVLEPLEYLGGHGFEVTLVKPKRDGAVAAQTVAEALREETLLVSVMHVNNETGVIQPIEEIARLLESHGAFFHVDAAQGFGKDIPPLQNARIDLMSISGHKICAPKGIGALVVRRRCDQEPPLAPLVFGGGQELGLRPGTQPVGLIAALGKAAELATRDHAKRESYCRQIKEQALRAFRELGGVPIGDQDKALPGTLNVAIPGLDSEAVILLLRDLIAISNGAACTSQTIVPSHVLTAMGLPHEHVSGAVRLSWCHLTAAVPWEEVVAALSSFCPNTDQSGSRPTG